MGVDTKLFNPNKKDLSIKKKYDIMGPFLLFVGRLTEKKGVKYLIKAMPEVIKKYPKTKLMIIGEGELENELKELTRKLKMEENIIFIGAIQNKELPRYYATADIFIAPSIITKEGDREGLPVTIMEAMASGCVVITTDLEGNKDLIKDKKTGFLVEQKNSKDISKRILELLENKSLFNVIKKESIEKIRKGFDLEFVNRNFGEVLR